MSSKQQPQIIFKGRIVNGVRQYYRGLKHQKYLKSLEGKEFEEILTETDGDVTLDQHGYMRAGIIRKTCMQTDLFEGWTETEIYEYFADRHFYIPIIKTVNGVQKEFKHRLSMASCGIKRASEFIEAVLKELAENGIYPLSPDEYYYGKYAKPKTNGKS